MCIRDRFRACWLWMALYTSILPCVALVLLPAGGYLVLTGASTLPAYALVLCMSFSVGPPLVRAMNFMSVLPQLSYKIDQMESLFNIPPLKEGKTHFNGNDLQIRFENCLLYTSMPIIAPLCESLKQSCKRNLALRAKAMPTMPITRYIPVFFFIAFPPRK